MKEGNMLGGGGVTTLNRMVREGLFERVTRRDKKGQETKIWKQSLLGRGASRLGGPKQEGGLAGLSHRKVWE